MSDGKQRTLMAAQLNEEIKDIALRAADRVLSRRAHTADVALEIEAEKMLEGLADELAWENVMDHMAKTIVPDMKLAVKFAEQYMRDEIPGNRNLPHIIRGLFCTLAWMLDRDPWRALPPALMTMADEMRKLWEMHRREEP